MSNEQWSEWIEHNTNGCPVDGGMIVDIMKRDEKESGDHFFYPDLASNWDWSVDGSDGDIIAYRYRLDDNTMTPESDMHPDLEFLARNVSEWLKPFPTYIWDTDEPIFVYLRDGVAMYCQEGSIAYKSNTTFSKSQWLQARRDLGLVMSESEEEMDVPERIGVKSKYHRRVKGIDIDVYDVLKAFNVTNQADAHAIKKMLCAGQRGYKDANQDRQEAIDSIKRAMELEDEV